MIGNGTFSRDDNIEYSNPVGSISWWKLVIATYRAGKNNVVAAAINLTILEKFANVVFKFVSSGDVKKSENIAGVITPAGVPFTIITALPFNKYFAALSGLSVDISWGRPKRLESEINWSNSPSRH